MDWKESNVLITGANGFLGSWVTSELVNRGANVTAIIRDRIRSTNLELCGAAQKINVVSGSITDMGLMQRAMNEYEIDTCFHLAAQAIVGAANRSPISTFESNITGTWSVMEACRTSPTLKRVIVASSDKAYGPQEKLPYREDSPLLGIYPYDASKACADIIARCFHATYGVPVAVTRYENIYGGGDLNFSRIIPGTIKSVLRNEKPVIRSDGTPERSFIYIKDAVSAYISITEGIGKPGVAGSAFNVGTGCPITVMDIVKKILRLSGRTDLAPNVAGEGKPRGEIDRQFLAVDKAKRLLGWSAKYTIDEGLKETIEWYRNYFSKNGKV